MRDKIPVWAPELYAHTFPCWRCMSYTFFNMNVNWTAAVPQLHIRSLLPPKIKISQYSPPLVTPYKLKSIRATCVIIPWTFLLQRSMMRWKDAAEKPAKWRRETICLSSPLYSTPPPPPHSHTFQIPDEFCTCGSTALSSIRLAPQRWQQRQEAAFCLAALCRVSG